MCRRFSRDSTLSRISIGYVASVPPFFRLSRYLADRGVRRCISRRRVRAGTCPRTPARRPGRPPRPRHATQPRPRTRSTRSRAPPLNSLTDRTCPSGQPPPASEPPRPRRHAGALCLRPAPVARVLPLRLCMCTFSIVIKGSLSKPLSLKRNVVLLCSAGCVLSLRHTGGAYLA